MDIMTNVYHIVQYQDNEAYVFFHGCSWNCCYCIRKISRWDNLLPKDIKRRPDDLWKRRKVKFLNIEEVVKILRNNKIKIAFLGGYEPTIDKELKPSVRELKDDGIKTWLLTNGEYLDEEIINLIDEITFSIKAFDDDLHKLVTGASNIKILRNFRWSANSGKIVAETVYAKGAVECKEILKIAEFIASVNPYIKYRIDPTIQNPPSNIVLDRCIAKVKNLLPRTYRIKSRGKIHPSKSLYPVIHK